MENNKFVLNGEIVRDPYKTGSACFATIKVYSEGRLEYIQITTFHDIAEKLAEFKANDKIHAVCRLHSHKYEKNGNKIYATDIIADSVDVLS